MLKEPRPGYSLWIRTLPTSMSQRQGSVLLASSQIKFHWVFRRPLTSLWVAERRWGVLITPITVILRNVGVRRGILKMERAVLLVMWRDVLHVIQHWYVLRVNMALILSARSSVPVHLWTGWKNLTQWPPNVHAKLTSRGIQHGKIVCLTARISIMQLRFSMKWLVIAKPNLIGMTLYLGVR